MHGECTLCSKLKLRWQLVRDPKTNLPYCEECWQCRYECGKIAEGRENYFQFYRWLYRKAHLLTEWPDHLVVLCNGEERPVRAGTFGSLLES